MLLTFKFVFIVASSFFLRVRVEVLRALANRVSNSHLLTYCVATGPRPKLSVGPAQGFPGRRQALFYTEAIKKYGHLLADEFLDKAYDRCQMFFTGAVFPTFYFSLPFSYFFGFQGILSVCSWSCVRKLPFVALRLVTASPWSLLCLQSSLSPLRFQPLHLLLVVSSAFLQMIMIMFSPSAVSFSRNLT